MATGYIQQTTESESEVILTPSTSEADAFQSATGANPDYSSCTVEDNGGWQGSPWGNTTVVSVEIGGNSYNSLFSPAVASFLSSLTSAIRGMTGTNISRPIVNAHIGPRG